MFKVIIAGGRDFNDWDLMCKKLDTLLGNVEDRILVITGGAKGADKYGKRYAEISELLHLEIPAEWDNIEDKPEREIGKNRDGKLYWKVAGHVRNAQMTEIADALIAFWDGKSKGTKSMIDIATKKFGKDKVRVVKYNKNSNRSTQGMYDYDSDTDIDPDYFMDWDDYDAFGIPSEFEMGIGGYGD